MKNRYKFLDKYPDVLNVDDICELLGVSKNTAYMLVRKKIIKSCKIGNMYRVPKTFLIDYFEENSIIC